MKEYTINDFRVNDYAYKPMTDSGRMGYYSGRYEINYSSILTRLIQEAGRFCESFASDLFIDWESVLDFIKEHDGAEIDTAFLFGFRQYGVDHLEYVLSRYNQSGDKAQYNYRSLWRLDVKADGDEITMTLGRVF